MLKEITELTWKQTIGGVFCFLGTIAPGFLILYLYKPDLIESLETMKLIIFSLSLTLPLFFINIVGLSVIDKELEKQQRHFEFAVVAMFFCSVAAYPAILTAYLQNLPFKAFLVALLIWQVVVWLGVFITTLPEKFNSSAETEDPGNT